MPLFGKNFEPWVLFLLPPGGFISLAVWLLTFTYFRERKKRKQVEAVRAEEAAAQAAVSVEVHA